MIVIMMGVTASGKTTVGQRLAQRLEWIFADGDDYHSQANRDKMSDGVPLTDADRAPWLLSLNRLLADWEDSGINGVLACSALKQQYRDVLTQDVDAGNVRVVVLEVPRELLEARLEHRRHAFMNPALLGSQLEILEEPADGLKVEATDSDGRQRTVDEVTGGIIAALGLVPAHS